MIIRKSASALLATLLVSATFGTAASAATTHHRTMHHARAGAHHPTQSRSGASRTPAGSAATDALNEQSLNSARGGTTPAMTPAPAQ